MAEVKKPNITNKYKVKVFNNTSGKVTFRDMQNKWQVINPNGFLLMNYEDVENLLFTSPNFIENGYVFIGDKYVREKLEIKDVIQYRHIKDMVLNYSIDELKDVVKTAEDWMVKEFGNIAFELKDNLSLAKLKYLQEISGIELIETLE